MKKILVLIMNMLLAIGLFSACNKSDEVTDINNHSEKEGADTIEKGSDLMVGFQLQNEDGMECYDFKEGDNTIFWLEIKNDTDEDVILSPFSEVLGFDVFTVYSQEGVKIGTPWDVIMTSFRECEIIGAHNSVVFVCPWFDIPALYYNGTHHYYSEYFYKKDDKSPLPQGEYFSEFDIKLNGKTITCYRKFDIR
jgi:hypothetical protein